MKLTAVYNEHDPFAAQWLRNLIAAGVIAPGEVDERSIEDVVPVEYAKYTQVHLFAGIGVWSYGMRNAGWSDDRKGWSCSCPCQPFSAAGQGAGFADERHLWPAAFHLIAQCGPDVVIGEQVASKDGFVWLDLVQSDMEGADYTFGACVTPSAGYGAPHIRHRTYWMAYADNPGLERRIGMPERGNQRAAGPYGLASGMAGTDGVGRQMALLDHGRSPAAPGVWQANVSGSDGALGRVANPFGGQLPQEGRGAFGRTGQSGTSQELDRPGPVNGIWRAADWLRCRDDKWRPVEAGTFPLVNGVTNRMGSLRGYGNAVNAAQAEEWARLALEHAP